MTVGLGLAQRAAGAVGVGAVDRAVAVVVDAVGAVLRDAGERGGAIGIGAVDEIIPVVVPSTTTGIILKTLVESYGVLPPELVETVTP